MAHRAGPLASAAMGRTLTSAVLLAADFKDDFLLAVAVEGDGPLGRVMGEVRTGGKVRARVDHPEVDLPLRADGKLDVGQGVGRSGSFRVTREDDLGRFESQVELASGEIGDDLARYYLQSEQIPSAVAVGVLVGREGLVAASGGLVVQMLPGGEGMVDSIIERLDAVSHISYRLDEGHSPEDLIRAVLPAPVILAEPEPLEFRCRCSRENSLDILLNLPSDEREALIRQKGAEVVCNYCRTRYRFSDADIRTD